MLRTLFFWIFCCLQLSLVFADDIDADYYFGSSYEVLRARDGLDCNNPVNQLFCKLQCQNDVGVCYASKCYCVYEPKPDIPKKSRITTHVDSPEHDVVVRYNPSRRHHIAHFCPDLKKARKCIRKCMKEGKPAFCGKDHVCYCGHRYYSNQKQDELDPEKIKNGFYDLYLKYFGPDTSLMPPPPKTLTNKKSPNMEDNKNDDIKNSKSSEGKEGEKDKEGKGGNNENNEEDGNATENKWGYKGVNDVDHDEDGIDKEDKGADKGGNNENHEEDGNGSENKGGDEGVNDVTQEQGGDKGVGGDVNGKGGDGDTVDGTTESVTQDEEEATTVQTDTDRRNLQRKQYKFSL